MCTYCAPAQTELDERPTHAQLYVIIITVWSGRSLFV